jgi:hypothetical protein
MLILMSRPANERGGAGDRAFMAFKLHRFLSGAGHVYATLRGTPGRITCTCLRGPPPPFLKESRVTPGMLQLH